ncbi:MAG: hypothetical protein CTY25_01475 [Methylobacterium sp.]|nr:MAG: hypothetical protein CTY25_01475 [Methylobacterium sp.]
MEMLGSRPLRLALQAPADEQTGILVDAIDPFRVITTEGFDAERHRVRLREDEPRRCLGRSKQIAMRTQHTQ